MSKKIRIKDIADEAGVSAGTVDRILHNRGGVSKKNRELVEKVLDDMGYQPNIHLSSLSVRRKYKVVFVSPNITSGEYWESVKKGIDRAINEFKLANFDFIFKTYNQYDVYSYRNIFDAVKSENPSAVVIGPTYKDETVAFSKWLDENKIPYIYIDSPVSDTLPVAFYSANPFVCGSMMCKLVSYGITNGDEIGILQMNRIGSESANTTVLRKEGFMDFYTKKGLKNKINTIPFSIMNPEKHQEQIDKFFQEFPKTKSVVVLNSKSSVLANYLSKDKYPDVRLIGLDLTQPNVNSLKKGEIDFLLSQRPEMQGYMATKSIIEHLLYGKKMKVENYLPIDIITNESIDLYKEFME